MLKSLAIGNFFMNIFLRAKYFILLALFAVLLICSCSDSNTLVYGYKVVRTYPHDPNAYTQGLVFENGFLYEGTGLNESSTLRRVELETGNILQMRHLPSHLFGEGITIYGDSIIQLTWKSKLGFVYDKDTFELKKRFSYPMEGWGITHDEKHLIISDGTSTLHLLDPKTFQEVDRIDVRKDGVSIDKLNELEYVQGKIYANIYREDNVVIIDPQTGNADGWIELKGLLSLDDQNRSVDVLNGIAYDAKNDRLFVTGKLWPKLFEIDLVEPLF